MQGRHLFSGLTTALNRLALTVAATVGLAALPPLLGEAQAMGADPVEVLLHCPTTVPQPEALCAALGSALQDGLDGTPVLGRQSDAPLPATGAAVRLALTGLRSDRLSGYLEWQGAEAGTPPARGPEIALDVMDANLGAAIYAGFARALLASSPELLATLRQP